MNLKRYTRYRMDFCCKWLRNSVFLMGLTFFLQMVSFFALCSIDDHTTGEWIFQLVLPSLLCMAHIVLIRVLKWDAPGIYAIIGCIFCLLLIIWSFSSGNVLRILLSLLVYAAAGISLLATAGGYFPGRMFAAIMFIIPLFFRILLFCGGISGLNEWITEISILSVIGALVCLPLSFYPVRNKSIDE